MSNIIKGYSTIGGVSKVTESGYVNIGGVWKPITEAYTNIGGVWKSAWEVSGRSMVDLDVGTIIKLNVGGTATDFIIVHQGNPDTSIYDTSCDGTWLLMKDVYSEGVFSTGNIGNNYNSSSVDNTILPEILGQFDSGIQSIVKTVKIPYWSGKYSAGALATGESGLSTKLFLLSVAEVGLTGEPTLGVVLDYFNSATNTKRIAYSSGTATAYFTRTPYNSIDTSIRTISTSGALSRIATSSMSGIRPALILPSETPIDDDNNIVL